MNFYKINTNDNFKINKLDTTKKEWYLRREFDANKEFILKDIKIKEAYKNSKY